MDRITDLKVFEEKSPNHVLINEYTAGQGIMVNIRFPLFSNLMAHYRVYVDIYYFLFQSHTDGPLFYPVVSTINCGSHVFLRFQSIDNDVSLNAEIINFLEFRCTFFFTNPFLTLPIILGICDKK